MSSLTDTNDMLVIEKRTGSILIHRKGSLCKDEIELRHNPLVFCDFKGVCTCFGTQICQNNGDFLLLLDFQLTQLIV